GDLRGEYEQRLAEMVVRLIEDPQTRMAGAEEALRQLTEHTERALQQHEELCRELNQRAAGLYQRLHQFLGESEPAAQGGGKTPSIRRGSVAAQAVTLLELLYAYPKCRYQGLVLQQVSALYVSLRGQLSDQLREVDFCRARLGELLGMFDNPSEP